LKQSFVSEAINKHEKSGLSRGGRKDGVLKKRPFAGTLNKKRYDWKQRVSFFVTSEQTFEKPGAFCHDHDKRHVQHAGGKTGPTERFAETVAKNLSTNTRGFNTCTPQ
jgi:hypothetical protein